MSRTSREPARPVLDLLGEVATEAFGVTEVVERFVVRQLASNGPARTAAIGGLRAVLEKPLTQPGGRLVGAGFVAAVGLFEDRPWWLDWFVREGLDVERLRVPLDPAQLGFYDYTTTRWFRGPERDGRQHVVGPYVDYLCTEDQTLTFARPVVVGERFVGVAGCDIRAVTLERELLPVLGRLDGTFVVVNDDDRVLCSNSGRYVCGDLLESSGVRRRHRRGDLSLTVAEPR